MSKSCLLFVSTLISLGTFAISSAAASPGERARVAADLKLCENAKKHPASSDRLAIRAGCKTPEKPNSCNAKKQKFCKDADDRNTDILIDDIVDEIMKKRAEEWKTGHGSADKTPQPDKTTTVEPKIYSNKRSAEQTGAHDDECETVICEEWVCVCKTANCTKETCSPWTFVREFKTSASKCK